MHTGWYVTGEVWGNKWSGVIPMPHGRSSWRPRIWRSTIAAFKTPASTRSCAIPTKADLGYAVVDEMVSNWILGRWVVPMEQANDPIDGLLQALNALTPDEIQMLREYGCPLNNLAQEMSAVDETFRHKIARVYQRWTERMADAFL